MARGAHTIGDFVLVNAMMIQLFQPLSYLGMVYRELRQATIDIEMMFDIMAQNPEVKDRPGAKPLARSAAATSASRMCRSATIRAAHLRRSSASIFRPAKRLPSSAHRAPANRRSHVCSFRFYEPQKGRVLIDGQDISQVTQFRYGRRSASFRKTLCCSMILSPTTSAMAAMARATPRSGRLRAWRRSTASLSRRQAPMTRRLASVA